MRESCKDWKQQAAQGLAVGPGGPGKGRGLLTRAPPGDLSPPGAVIVMGLVIVMLQK